MQQNYSIELQRKETQAQALARTVTSPECLSASVLTICQNIEHTQVNEMIDQLKAQSAAIHNDDLSRAESMLIAQAHTLDGLFAKLASHALTSNELGKLERYMKLALKAQSQARATLQTLGDIKAPKQIAFVKQANIGNQVQVNNTTTAHARTRKKQKEPNELLEAHHGERLDTRTKSKTGRVNQTVATMEKEHRADK
ncbi:hypothetical protein [Denitrificimonas caeni]|uniref:hypothetical protein n=1 Tax=Denitrificimonas caeni TaxID=521720 RepID=UPI001E41DE27|nr:hypothetical protein [Denitrificimonas caeni]